MLPLKHRKRMKKYKNERYALGIIVFTIGVSAFIIDTSTLPWWRVLIMGFFFMYFGLELLDVNR